MADSVKIRLLRGTKGLKRGSEILVSADRADALVANHHATRVFEVLDLEVDLGTIAGVLAEVGDDKAKAQSALDAERAKGDSARVTLIAKLQAVLDA